MTRPARKALREAEVQQRPQLRLLPSAEWDAADRADEQDTLRFQHADSWIRDPSYWDDLYESLKRKP